jgi:hypothetical protein
MHEHLHKHTCWLAGFAFCRLRVVHVNIGTCCLGAFVDCCLLLLLLLPLLQLPGVSRAPQA